MAYDYPVTAVVDANGNATCELDMVASAQVWEVRQISCYTAKPTYSGNVSIWKNNILQAPSAALTPIISPLGVQGSAAAAAGLPYITLNSGDRLQVIFSGCVTGDIATANVILEIYLAESYIPTPFG